MFSGLVAGLSKMGFSTSCHGLLTESPCCVCTAARAIATVVVNSLNLNKFAANGAYH